MKDVSRRPRRAVIAMTFGTLTVYIGLLTSPAAWGADLTNGKRIYKDKCLKCHGEKGKGDGPKADTLEKKPADYTDKAFMAKFTDDKLKEEVLEGKPPMPSFKGKLTDKALDDVIAYIRTFAQ